MEAVQCSCCSVFFYSVDEVQTCAMLHKRPYLSKADSMDNKKKGQTLLNLTFKVQLAHLLNFASLFKLETKPYCSDFFMKDWVVSFV